MYKFCAGGDLATNTFVNGFEVCQQYGRGIVEMLNRRIDARSNSGQVSFENICWKR